MTGKYLLFILFVVFFSNQIKSQVTIGLNNAPVTGALLQLKTEEVNDGGSNSTQGLLLPRVSFNTGSAGSGTDSQKLRISLGLPSTVTTDAIIHTGLLVYNLATNNNVSTDAPFNENKICPGVYIWDGTKWRRLMATTCD